MESTLGGQPDLERLPGASGQAKSRPETAQYNTPGAPPNGLSSDEAGSSTVVNAPAIPLSASPSLSQVQRSTTLEEILTQGTKEGGPATMVERMVADSASLELTLTSQGIEGEPAAKRMRLDSIEGRKDESELPSLSPVHSEDQPQLTPSSDIILSQRTLSQSSSLSDSPSLDNSALSPDIQSTLAQLSTSNLDIATRRNLLLGRTKNKYVCEVCGRECPSKHKLKRHLSTHSEERPFSCQICGKSFKWTEYLQKHMRQQHPGGVEGSPHVGNAQSTPTKSPLPCSHASPILAGSSQLQTTTSTASSSSSLPSPSLKSPPILSPSAKSRPDASNKPQTPRTVDSGVSVNMDQVLNSITSSERQEDSAPSKPTKQNASVGVNMDEEELAEEEAMIMTSSTHLTPLGEMEMNQDNLTISMGGAQLVTQSAGAVNIMSGNGQLVGGANAQLVGGANIQLGGMDGSGGQLEGSGLLGGRQVARGGANPHHIAMDSSGVCYATASISQPLTTFANGNGGQQQVIGGGAMVQGYNGGNVQTATAHVGQQGNSLQQPQAYSQDMLQQPLTSTCTVQDMSDPNSIPVSDQYSIPGDQQQQAMQVYSDQHMSGSHSMPEHDPNSMSVGSLHSMTAPDLITDSQQMGVAVVQPGPAHSDTVMMQDMSQMTQYTNYSMQDPMNTSMYGTETVTTPIQQTSGGVAPQSLGTQYPQVAQVADPLSLGDNSIAQVVVTQNSNSNVYASVASYETLDMQSQSAGVGMVPTYSNSQQQSMMVQTQTDMMGGYGVMHNGLLPTQQDMAVGVMDPAMYGSGANGGNNGMGGVGGGTGTQIGDAQRMLVESQQQQEIKKEQQQADNFISQQIKKHIMRSQTQKLQSHDNHVTDQQGTGGASIITQQQFTTSGGVAKPTVPGSNGVNEKPEPVKVVIVHETDTTVERYPVMHKSKKETIEVGIQCELGPETIKALIEEEEAKEMVTKEEKEEELQGEEDDDGCHSDEDNSQDKTLQKYPCEIATCAKAYIHRKDLIRHMKIRHGQSPLKLEPVTVEAREKPFVCPVGHCGRSYYHLKDLRRHQRLCHKVTLQPKTTSALKGNVEVDEDCKTQLRYPCDFPNCLRSYVHKKDLVRHKRLYHKDTAPRPTIPIPVRYTESELKRIKQEVKNEIDKSIEKIRLDSTGSTVSNATNSGGEDPPNSAMLIVPEAELSKLEPTSDSKSSNLPISVEPAINTGIPHSSSNSGARFVLFIDPNATTSSAATLVPASSTSQSSTTATFQQPSSIPGTSSGLPTTTEALSLQNLSKAILSSMSASLPPGQAQLDSTPSLVKMATGEQVDQALITSEVASILGALEQAHLRQLAQQQQQQQQQSAQLQQHDQGASGGGQVLLTSISADILGLSSIVSAISTPPTTTATTDSGSVQLNASQTGVGESAVESKSVGVLESIETEMNISQTSELDQVASAAASLHQLFASTNQEPSKVPSATNS